jgi:hypothetical protein
VFCPKTLSDELAGVVVPKRPKGVYEPRRTARPSAHLASRRSTYNSLYRASAELHQLTGDFFRSSSFIKKSTPGDISATVVPFKKALLQL